MNKPSTYILLPTDKASPIWITTTDGKAHLGKSEESRLGVISQHIYILSNDEIKEGDWFLDTITNKFYEDAGGNNRTGLKEGVHKKIIATTNPELHKQYADPTIKRWVVKDGIPSISQSDIEYIISLYNGKGKEIDVEGLAEKMIRQHPDWIQEGLSEYQNGRLNGIIAGYNRCLSDNADKKFTLDDIIQAMYYARNLDFKKYVSFEEAEETIKIWANGFLESFTKKPKRDTVMVEYEKVEWSMSINPTLVGLFQPKFKDGCIIIVR